MQRQNRQKTKFCLFCPAKKTKFLSCWTKFCPANGIKGQNFVSDEIAWQFDCDEPNPYQLEWNHLIEAIRQNTPYNEVRRGVQASVVTAMGRLSAHTGQRVTYDEMLNHEH